MVFLWEHRRERPYTQVLIAVFLLLIGLLIAVINTLTINPYYQIVIFSPIYEELIKVSVFFLFIVSYVEYRHSPNEKNRNNVISATIIFLIMLVGFSIGDILNPVNYNKGDILFLFFKQLLGHLSLTAVGVAFLSIFYKKEQKISSMGVLLTLSLVFSMVLHTLANQMTLGIYPGKAINDFGLSQDFYFLTLFIIALASLLYFLKSNDR